MRYYKGNIKAFQLRCNPRLNAGEVYGKRAPWRGTEASHTKTINPKKVTCCGKSFDFFQTIMDNVLLKEIEEYPLNIKDW